MADRLPRSVYNVGAEPDPRFSLANERTFLAWTRTALAFMAAGVALEALNVPIHAGLRLGVALLLNALGILAGLQAWMGWAGTERALRTDAPLPDARLKAPVVVGLLLVGVGLMVGLLAR